MEGVKSLTLQFLEEFNNHISAKLLLRPHVFELKWTIELPEGFTGLRCVAYLGANEVANALLDAKEWDVDKADLLGPVFPTGQVG